MNPNRLILILCLAGCAWLSPVMALAAPSKSSPLSAEVRHPVEEKTLEASFRTWIAQPGSEHFAIQLILNNPQSCLQALQQLAKSKSLAANPQVSLFTAEAFRALEKPEVALTWYRQYLKQSGKNPPGYYPVELPEVEDQETVCFRCSSDSLWLPFVCGPGSFRDNLVLRRLIELKAWKEAELEFARIWKHHHIMVGNRAFPGQSLQFVLDYAWFLKTRNQPKQELNVLLKPINRMDLDRNPVFEYQRDVYAALRNPNQNQKNTQLPHLKPGTPPPVLFQIRCGVTQRVFLKLVLERLTELNQLSALEQLIAKELNSGNRAAQLIQALMLEMQGKPEAARQLELSYIEHLPVSAASKHFYKALVFEKYGEFELALNECKQLLPFLNQPVTIPDAIEFDSTNLLLPFNQSDIIAQPCPLNAREVLKRMEKLAAATGNVKEAFQFKLQQIDQQQLKEVKEVEFLRQEALATSAMPEFAHWARALKGNQSYDQFRLALALRDVEAATRYFVEAHARLKEKTSWPLSDEMRQLSESGQESYQTVLQSLIHHFPQNVFFRLELLHVKNELESEEGIRLLELLLSQTGVSFSRQPNINGKTTFGGYLQVAQRLMDLYARTHQSEKMLSLALRLARCKGPFSIEGYCSAQKRSLDPQLAYQTQIQVQQLIDLTISHLSDPAQLQTLREALDNPRWEPLKEKLNLQTSRSRETSPDLTPGIELSGPGKKLPEWANLPPGVHLITGMEQVLGLCHDEKWVYVGHPWGVSIFDFQGNLVTRVATQSAAASFAPLNGDLWIGTPTGLLKLDCQTFTLAQLPVDWGMTADRLQEIYTNQKNRRNELTVNENQVDPLNGVQSLVPQGEQLWISTQHNICRYNPRTQELRVYPTDEITNLSLGNWDALWVDGQYVWARSSLGGYPAHFRFFRYDPHTDDWTSYQDQNQNLTRILGNINGKLWVYFTNPDQLEGFGYLKSQSLEMIPVSKPIPSSLLYCGKAEGKMIFQDSSSSRFFSLDEESNTLKAVGESTQRIETDIPGALWYSTLRVGITGTISGQIHSNRHEIFGQFFESGGVHLLRLPNGTQIIGAGGWSTFNYFGLSEWPLTESLRFPLTPTTCGLRFRFADGRVRLTTLPENQKNILGDIMYSLTFDPATSSIWLGTNYGVSVLNENLELLRTFTSEDGLIMNSVTGAVRNGQKLYLSHSIPANDNLTQVDLDTGLFQSIKTTDSALMEQLKLATSLPPEESAKPNRRGIPYLGGWIAGQRHHHGKVYVYGSRGLLVVDGTEVPPLVKYPLLPVKLTSNQSFLQLNEAKSVVVPVSFSLDEFRHWTQTDNPYLLARVLEVAGNQPLTNPDEWISFLLSFTSHSHKRVRATALNALKSMNSPAILEAFKKLVDDPDLAIRFLATIEVTRRDKPLALERYADYFRWNAPFLPVGADRFEYLPPDAVYEALLPHLNPEILRLFLAFPLIHPRSQSSNVLEKLSQMIFKDEALREVLLNPTCPLVLPTFGALPQSKNYTTFVYKIVRPWGEDAVLLLQKKLVSPNPSVRSLAMSLLLKFNDFLSNMGKGEIPIPSRDIGKALTREIDVAIFEPRRTHFQSNPILIHFLANVRPFQNKFDEESLDSLQATTYREWEFFEDLGDSWPQPDVVCPQLAKPQERQFTKLDSRMVYSFYPDAYQSLSPDLSKAFEDRAFLKLLSQADRKAPTFKQYFTKLQALRLYRLLSDPKPEIKVSAAASLVSQEDQIGQKILETWLSGTSPLYKKLIVNHFSRWGPEKRHLIKFLNQLNQCATDPTLPAETQAQARALVKKIESTPR